MKRTSDGYVIFFFCFVVLSTLVHECIDSEQLTKIETEGIKESAV